MSGNRKLPLATIVASMGLLFSGCHKLPRADAAQGSPPASLPQTPAISAMPTDHEFTRGEFVAKDLEHGALAARLELQRIWGGAETSNTHFGPGWSDINAVRLTLIDKNVLLIWRGGAGWRTAYRHSETSFTGDYGEIIQQTS